MRTPPHYDELFRFIAQSVKDQHEAQDLTQQTFERLLTKYGSVPQEQQRALLYEIARNLLIDRYRQQQRHQTEDASVLDDMPAAECSQPEVIYAQRQRFQQLLETLEALSPRCKQAFVLHKIEGHSQAEVAQLMGISINMVERHIMIGMAACRKKLLKTKQAQSHQNNN